ncbi:alkaline phosphatase family protein [Neorhodopirellula pilleata]|uniref:Sulfatase N-terminal domain-containing protein n=1 Tax=Neorhodopirellula pilleata TaxID=2714738 RepID=A0A5C5ZY12_9BACT|nr:hypothetical protein [Neorhodopirellula pilleata]TWT91898.1 hypothetical protein Pla100_49380 [Neorhodopirellula pilleata]
MKRITSQVVALGIVLAIASAELGYAGRPNVVLIIADDLIPYLGASQNALPERPMYWRVGERAALRRGHWKVSRQAGKGASLAWTLTDLKNDFAEQNDLADRHAGLLNELVAEWEKVDAQMVQPAW